MPPARASFLVGSIRRRAAGCSAVVVVCTVCVSVVMACSLVLVGGRDGDEREAEVADLAEQAVECGLVGDRAVENGGAVGLSGQGHAVEPGGPAVGEVSFHADLVPIRFLGRTHGRRLPSRWPDRESAGGGCGARWNTSKAGPRCDERSSPHLMSGVMKVRRA